MFKTLINAHLSFPPFTIIRFQAIFVGKMKKFGAFGVHVKNIITYSLSPYEQKTFAGVFSRGVPNIIRRFKEEVFYIFPALTIGALVYHFGTKDYHRRMRKNPADYENEE